MKKIIIALVLLAVTAGAVIAASHVGWSDEELATMHDMSIDELGKVPADPTNRYADNPAAAKLGKQIFFDTRFSANGKVACATCHMPDHDFQDDRPRGLGVGVTGRRTPPIVDSDYNTWMFWDGRKDSQWSQALGPLESSVEHGGKRGQYVRVVAQYLDSAYHSVFGGSYDDTTRVFANIGKAIAAFERTYNHDSSRFDEYVRLGNGLSVDELRGLKLFMGKGQCANCHTGPLLTDNAFHNIGIKSTDRGRADGAKLVLADEFNCLSKYSDAKPDQCTELKHIENGPDMVGAFKTPSLRNVTKRSPYMHDGSMKTLDEVLDHYSRAPHATVGTSELKPVKLSMKERKQIIAFLHTLESQVLER